MSASNDPIRLHRVQVSDLDGTMIHHDFYSLAIELALRGEVPVFWDDCCEGTITHIEALQQYFARLRVSEQDILSAVEYMELDPDLPDAIDAMQSASWSFVVASVGCDWSIRRLRGARSDLVNVLQSEGLPGHSYDSWSQNAVRFSPSGFWDAIADDPLSRPERLRAIHEILR